MKDKEFLQFIYCRLIEVHGENPNHDYMLRLKEIIKKNKSKEPEIEGVPI